MLLDDKVAVVTGGSIGIGAGIARKLASEGAHVVLTGRNHLCDATELAEELKGAYGVEVLPVSVDLAQLREVDLLVKQTMESFGRIDVLVNNAGVMFGELIEHTTEEMFDCTFDVNVKGHYFLTKNVVPFMRAQKGGSIVFTGSVFGPTGMTYATSYAASKMALHGLSTCLAVELAPTIRSNVVVPGNVDVPSNEPVYAALGGRDAVRACYPLDRLGNAVDVANAVAFLASDEASWITGVCLPVDGGYLAK